MSQPSAGQSQRNESVGGDSCETPNGIENTNNDESHPTPDFGIFDDKVQLGLKKLQGGVHTVDSAVAELTKTFGQHEDIVNAVKKRWGQDKSLEEEIHDLKVAKDEVWNRLEESRKTHKKKITDLKREHGKEVSRLEAEANEGQQEKAKYEKMQRSLKDQHDTAMQNMEAELKQKKTEIELESTGKIAALEKEKRELEAAKARLEGDLTKKTNELDQEKETRKTMQDKLSGDIRELQKTLKDIKAKYEMEEKSLEF
jgi:chromosome segregation ATPase